MSPSIHASAPLWEVEFHDDFDAEFKAFSVDVQTELLATARVVERFGPDADRPHVGTLGNSKHPNMKELRFTANHGAEVWRVAFAFDPQRKAILLGAADKQGTSEAAFYRKLLKKANQRFDSHLAQFESQQAKVDRRKSWVES